MRIACLSYSLEIIIVERKIFQAWQGANAVGNRSRQLIPCEIQYLNALQPSQAIRQDPDEVVVSQINEGRLSKGPEFLGYATAHVIVQENDLV